MTKCCIVMCGASKNKNRPRLTLHRFPKNEALRKKWLKAIGEENINPRLKNWFVCLQHFEESCCNRTLDVMRLRDDSLPTILPITRVASQNTSVLHEISSIDNVASTSSAAALFPLPAPEVQKEVIKYEKIKSLKEKCLKQQKKIKCLNEKLRRKDKKIANMEHIIKGLQQKNQINREQAVIIEDLAGSQDFLKRQVLKSKKMPLPNKYSEDIRKFALTLHFLSPKAYKYVRQTYNTCLPHIRTLSKWYEHVNADPGFTKEDFETFKIKVQESKYPVICSLVFDEMAIRKSLIWDPRTQKYHGRVDYGLNLDCDSLEEASQALVVMLTSINGSWKIPIA